MNNIIQYIANLVNNCNIVGDIDDYNMETPMGLFHKSYINNIRLYDLVLDFSRSGFVGFSKKRAYGYNIYFYHSYDYPRDRREYFDIRLQNKEIISAIVSNEIKIITLFEPMAYNNEYIKSIEIDPDGTLRVETLEGVVTTTTPDGVKTTVKPNGTKLILRPDGFLTVITSEGVTSVLAISANIATITQLILMVVDMRLRKKKEAEINTSNQKISEKLEDLKEIAVQMNDRTLTSFKSWKHNPDEVVKFVEMFQSKSVALKPRLVKFIFKNGSKLEIKVDENTEDQQKLLDEFIKYLNS